MNRSGQLRTAALIALAIAAAAMFAPSARADEKTLRAAIHEPFEVNGQLFPAGGRLTVRHIADYTPSSTVNEVCVGGRCLGMLLARDVEHKPVSAKDSLIFARNAAGTMVLVGVAFRDEHPRELLSFVEVGGVGRWVEPSANTGALLAASATPRR